MKLYCVFNTVDYEGDEFIGVFSSEALAEAEIARLGLHQLFIKTCMLDTPSDCIPLGT